MYYSRPRITKASLSPETRKSCRTTIPSPVQSISPSCLCLNPARLPPRPRTILPYPRPSLHSSRTVSLHLHHRSPLHSLPCSSPRRLSQEKEAAHGIVLRRIRGPGCRRLLWRLHHLLKKGHTIFAFPPRQPALHVHPSVYTHIRAMDNAAALRLPISRTQRWTTGNDLHIPLKHTRHYTIPALL